MDKEDIKAIYEEIDEYFSGHVGGTFESSDLEFIRSSFRDILQEEHPSYIELTYDERHILIDMDYHDGNISLAWVGDDFIATEENIKALEGVIDKFKERIMRKVKRSE